MHFSNLKIGTKLGLGFGFVITLLCGIVVLAVFNLTRLHAGGDKIVKQDWIKAKLASSALDNVRGSIARVFQIVTETDDAQLSTARQRLKANIDTYQEALRESARLAYRAEGKAILGRAEESSKKYLASIDRVMRLKDEGKIEDARRIALSETYEALHLLAADVRAFYELQQKLVEESATQMDETFDLARAEVVGLGLVALLAGVLFAWLITRAIVVPLGIAVRVARTVASGDLTSTIVPGSKDEAGELLHALRDMNASLANIVTEVRDGTAAISAASEQIAAGNMDLSSRTEQQASSLEETASSMEELTVTVKQNADSARLASELAASATEAALQGGTVVSQVVSTMEAINTSASKIADITAVIDGIAFQTNILALNAAVEAARAGEQGRGFAVVATEVRSLAQRSASAAKEIKQLIGDSVDRVEDGNRLVGAAGETMQEIVARVQRVNGIVGEIASASDEQRAGIEQVNDAIGQMDQVTQQNAALVEQAAAAAQAMSERAGSLAALVSKFRTGGTADVSPRMLTGAA
ncbi:methyl-accepting chemotaxis protein [Noviherbaspirillum denitrificans]|uniref:Chemotaxis protein n=1 Tax=Noviherbaspirillum denitrificans TaxID=1968433 RepID=A0A254TF79_9BURK|nr:methyl-accepting chemotaxis protein [Noviherbaspirillum denitrificans]OWW21195.1 chemotaxis protein [Noviherbaspirillum denitrificans]